MIRRIWRNFANFSSRYSDPVQSQQASDLARFTAVFGVIATLGFYIPVLAGLINLSSIILVLMALFPIAFLSTLLFIRNGRLAIASSIFIALLMLLALATIFTGIRDLTVMALILPIVATGLLTSRSTAIIVTILMVVAFIYALIASPEVRIIINADNRLTNLITGSAIFTFAGALLAVFGSNAQRLASIFSIELNDLRRVSEAPELIDLKLSETEILTTTLKTLRSGFGYSFTQLYLLDDARHTAQRLYVGFGLDELQRGDRFDINTANAVGECLRTGQVIKIDADSSDMRQRHLSAGMRTGILIPLLIDNQPIGAMDLQNAQPHPITNTQLEALSTYGQRLAVALLRARLLTQLREDVREQETIIIKQRQRLHEYERSEHNILPTNTWATYFEQNINGLVGFNIDMKNSRITNAQDLPTGMRESLENGELVVVTEDGHQIANIPIFLRDQLLGAMSFKLPKNAVLTERQRELLNSVVQRLALALENKRLFEQSQAQALRESKANEVASLLLSTTDIDTVLQFAAQSFNEALGAINTQIHLQQIVDVGDTV